MTIFFMTVVLTTAINVGLLVFAFSKIRSYLRSNPEAQKKVIEHLLVPLFRKKPEAVVEVTEENPEVSSGA